MGSIEEEFQLSQELEKWAQKQRKLHVLKWFLIAILVLGGTLGATIYFDFSTGLQISTILTVGFIFLSLQFAINSAADSFAQSLIVPEIMRDIKYIRINLSGLNLKK